ncbi:uncharacterized protein LOC110844806 [Folsomia candida]|nr:uncharacterized protein LOC110844806 [Folsomia candida]
MASKHVLPLLTLLVFLANAHIYDYYPNNYYPANGIHQHQSYFPPLPPAPIGNNFGNTFYNQIPNILTPFQLPRQVRVPGRIEIIINGDIAEILCEFPRYLILIQKLHWHHRYDDPYGTYYDTNQNFAPRISIKNDSKYKSILRIQGFNEDDFGHWRCLSSAVLPEDVDYLGNLRNLRKKRSYYDPKPPIKGLFAPFFRPSYGLFGIFQEIKFAPLAQQGGSQQLVRATGNNTI